MTRNENLLVTLMEECAEVQQSVSKALRFGLDNLSPVEQMRNKDLIMHEFYQLVAVVDMLVGDETLPQYDSSKVLRIKASKQEKVLSYQKFSKDAGLIV